MSFTLKHMLHNKAKTLLHMETSPGLGCTEPAAIALGAAAAASLLPDRNIESIEVTTDPNIYKNAMGVILPASRSQRGIPLASAMGAVAGDPEKRLQVFAAVDAQGLQEAESLVHRGKVSAGIRDGNPGIYIRTVVHADGHSAEAVIERRHDQITRLELDGKPLEDHPLLQNGQGDDSPEEELESWLTTLSLGEIVELIEDLDSDDVRYIKKGIALNMELVGHGLSKGPGLGVGKGLLSLVRQGLLTKDMSLAAGIFASAGIDARMGGVMLPAMTLGGSGNQGIAAGIPLTAVADFVTLEDPWALARAVTLSYLVTCYVKIHAGRVGPLCGSGVAGGAGVAAGVVYLFGGTVEKIGGAIRNHMENFATVVCDGAKTSCAFKAGEAVSSAVKSGLVSLQGIAVKPGDGFVEEAPEATMRNLGILVRSGLTQMDEALLGIMMNRSE